MNLYSQTTSERNSRPAKKGGDEYIRVQLKKGNDNRFDILYNGERIEVLNYCTGDITPIDYKA